MTRMPEHIREKVELVVMFAEDGAYHTAAERLLTLAEEVKAHANKVSPSKILGLPGDEKEHTK